MTSIDWFLSPSQEIVVEKSISKMTYFMSTRMININSIILNTIKREISDMASMAA